MSVFLQKQRTVYRLTLVKAWNVDELRSYADLIEIGKPDFIEVKVSLNISLLAENVWHMLLFHQVFKKNNDINKRSHVYSSRWETSQKHLVHIWLIISEDQRKPGYCSFSGCHSGMKSYDEGSDT